MPSFPHHHPAPARDTVVQGMKSRVRNGHLSSPMGNVMAETRGNARASSVLRQDQLGPRSSASMAAANWRFLLIGQENNSPPHKL